MPEWKAHLIPRLASLRLSPAREQEIVDELSQHLDDTYDELRAAGATLDDALRGALAELDEQDLLAREMRPLRQAVAPPPIAPGAPRTRLTQDLAQDLRYAARLLLHTPAWTLVVTALLAIGIGANTALFSATNALLVSSLPVKDPDSLVRFRWVGRNDAATELDEYGYQKDTPDGQRVRSSLSYSIYQLFAADARDKADLFACVPLDQMSVFIDGQAELADGFAATGNFFSVLGVNARLGRVFTPDDDRPSAPGVAVIGSRYWQSRFGANPAIVGRTITVNGVPVTIVGVLPPEFTGVQQALAEPPDITFPLTLDLQLKGSSGRSGPSFLDQPTAWWLEVMGRLRPGVTAVQLEASLDGQFKRTARASLDAYVKSLPAEEAQRMRDHRDVPRLLVDSGRRGVYDVETDAVTFAAVLSAVVVVILLIVCANVANLMLSRMVARRKEISVRLSLGASRTRLVRQLLTEALLLASTGALLGLVVAYWGVRLLPPPASTVSIFHGQVFAFAVLATILTTVVFGAVPALRATRVDVNSALKESGRSVAGRRSVLARALLITQVALSMVLLVGAGLFLRTLTNLRQVDVGFKTDNLLLVRLMPRLSGYDSPRTIALYRTLLDRLAAIPGVSGTALAQPALLSGSVSSTNIYVEGGPPVVDRSEGEEHSINRLVVSPEFFRVFGLPLVMGRGLTERDTATAPRVTVINETAARRFFPNQNPVGRRFGPAPDRATTIEVVGVVRDAKYSSVREDTPPTMYDTYLQSPRVVATIALRTQTPPTALTSAVRSAIHDIDPNLPIVNVSTQVEQMERRFRQERMFAQAYTLFGGLALLLASVGLFGLMSYSVARRTAELGIRMALGAQRPAVVRMIMRESMHLVIAGLSAGLAVAVGAGRFVASLLFGLEAHDAPTMAVAAGVLMAVSALAAYLPARRASLVDPMVALRDD